MAMAQEKAKSVAKAGGFKLGKLLSVEESTPYAPVMLGRGGVTDSSFLVKEEAVMPQIEAGSEEIKIQVYLRYEIR